MILLFRSSISSTILPCSASTLRITSSRASSTHLNKWFSFFRYIETKIKLGETKWNEKTACLSYTIEYRIRQKKNITNRKSNQTMNLCPYFTSIEPSVRIVISSRGEYHNPFPAPAPRWHPVWMSPWSIHVCEKLIQREKGDWRKIRSEKCEKSGFIAELVLNMSGFRFIVDLVLVGFDCWVGSKVWFTRSQIKCITFDSIYLLLRDDLVKQFW